MGGRAYGTITHVEIRKSGRPTKVWCITADPHVMMRLKRIFPRVLSNRSGQIHLADTPEIARDLSWVLERWPMDFDEATGKRLFQRDQDYRDREESVLSILNGYVPPTELLDPARPARDYQSVAANIVLATGQLLIADDLGLGKSMSAILTLRDPRALPALVITLTHLPEQWLEELHKTLPWLTGHVLRSRTPYDLTTVKGGNGAQPDVLITNYHKLAGWADELAGKVRTVIFDEAQELRHDGTQKYQAAAQVADAADFRVGLSVGPDSVVEFHGGPFHDGWVGRIEDASIVVGKEFPMRREGKYEVYDVRGAGIQARGWTGQGFGWKAVQTFVQHPCTSGVRTIRAQGTPLVLTDEHSIYHLSEDGLHLARADEMAVGALLAADNGTRWGGVKEVPFDMIELASQRPSGQVVVDLSGAAREGVGLTAWQWQNCNREGMHGTRLPVSVYRENAAWLPTPNAVYLSSGTGGRRVPPSIRLSEWAYVLGFYLGDGWTEGTRIAFAVEEALVPQFLAELSKLTDVDIDPKVSPAREQGSREVRFGNPLMADMIRLLTDDARCYDKFIPGQWIVSWDERARRELLRGLVDSGGHVAKQGERRYYRTTSGYLARGVLALLRSLGVAGSLSSDLASRNGGVANGRQIIGRRTGYTVHWSRHAEEGVNERHRGHRHRYSWTRGSVIEAPVRSVAPSPAPDVVYDLEMTGHPSFVADGVLVHNTATPIFNYGIEIWTVFNVIAPDTLGSKDEFGREWCSDVNGKMKVTNPAALGLYLRDQGLLLRRTRTEVKRELPGAGLEPIRIPHTIDLDEVTYDKLTGDAVALAELILSSETTGKERWRASGDLDWKLRQATGVAKAGYVADFTKILLESGEPVVLFGWHREVYDIWADKLGAYEPSWFTGSESTNQKRRGTEAFMNGDTPLLIMSLRAGAGLDGLQERCHVCVFGELDWSPAMHTQCIGRLFRDGQLDPVVAYFLVADSGADPVIADVLNLKRQQADPIVNPQAPLFQVAKMEGAQVKTLASEFLKRHRGVTVR